MAASMDEVEVIIVKPDKMINTWSGTFKLCALIVVMFALYAYFHIYVRAILHQYRQLNRMELLSIKSQKIVQHILVVDKNISITLEEMHDMTYS